MEKNAATAHLEHVEELDNQDQSASGKKPPKHKYLKVPSVELADAIAKDAPNYKAKSQVLLYMMVAFCTLSMSLAISLFDGN